DPFKAMDFLYENEIDLIFLDVNMPDISGLEFAQKILNRGISIIFTTAHSEYALESYEVEAVDYLLKPFDFPRFYTAVSKANERLRASLQSRGRNFFFVSTGNERHKIFYHDINWIEGNGNYVTYCLKDRKLLVRSTIKQTIAFLNFTDFVQVQRSYIVSLAHIDKILDNHVHIKDKRISIGPNYRQNFNTVIQQLNQRFP